MIELPSGLPTKQRRIFRVGGFGSGAGFGVHNNSFANVRRGLVERVFFIENDSKKLVPAPQPVAGCFAQLTKFRKLLGYRLGPHSRVSPQKFAEFYTGRRRTIYDQAVESLATRRVERRDSFLKTFVKAEKINLNRKTDPAPRVIQPRNVRYNVEVGRFLRPLEHHMYRAVDDIFGAPTIIKGYTVEQIGEIVQNAWNQFESPVAIGFDMKRFDQHVSAQALKWEHSVYLDAFHNDEYLRELLSWQIDNRGTAFASNGIIKYKKQGCRMSGDMNTAMGNCLISCAIVYAFLQKHSLKARLMNNGDDCVLIFDRQQADLVGLKMADHWLEFGFQCILEAPSTIIEEIEFCQMRPVLVGDKYIMVRDPKVTLAKDSYSIGAWNSINHAKKWVNAVGQCGISLTGGIPVVQAYYDCFIRNTTGVNGSSILRDVSFASGFRNLAKGGKRVKTHVSDDTRMSFYLAFGISPDRQIAMETDFENHVIDWGFCPQGNPPIQPLSWILEEMN